MTALGVTPVVQWYHPAWGKQDYLGLDVPLFDITGSIEALLRPAIDADYIIVFPSNGTWTSEENKDALKILESPIWRSVPAVKKGHVYPMERTHWQSGCHAGNMKKADDLVKAFVKESSSGEKARVYRLMRFFFQLWSLSSGC
ncbi:hypothetical protein BP422_18130 [Brevibacillus formosus]|uniref:Fe/B12 periplasmic-binding domain-containing protein n=1 Tax=Brevibacillus formosus TaxID=54913 RepID=A0A220MJJ6_9BACL|nr:hypothetical protein BP422_18130 [Brevibacillus formosus]